jgi:putative transposase
MKTEQEKAELAALYRAGTHVEVLCERFGVCKSTAYNWIKKFSPIKRTSCRRTVTPDSYYRLERETQTLRTENEIIRRSGFLLSVPLEAKIKTIDRLKSDFSVYILCMTLGVLKSTYYHHKLRAPARKWYELNDDKIRPIVKQIFFDSRERFGARKIKHALNKQGYVVSEAHISRLMKEMNLVCKQVRLRYFSTTNRKYKYYRNKVQRKFETEAPNLVWVSDLTNVYVKNTPYSIAVIIDLYARVVVAFDVRANATSKRMIGLF